MQCFNDGGESEYSNVMICETRGKKTHNCATQEVTHASTKPPLYQKSRHVSAKAVTLMTGMIAIITQHKCTEFYETNNNGLHFIVWYCVIFLCCWRVKSCSSCPLLLLCCSTSVPGVTQSVPHHPTWPPSTGATQPTWRTAVPHCGLCFGSDGAYSAGFYRHVSVEESPAEQHAQ